MINPFPYHERFEATQILFRRQLAILAEAIPAASEAIRPALVEIRHSAIDLHSKLEGIEVAPPLPTTQYGGI
ncbi:MAG TPA: hypothetical protein VHF07_02300, partial [Nitrospiraceae bacterium]|nr:hypothetical protein [Nitrospiraceae bacterium]